MKKPTFLHIICIIQLVVAAFWVFIVSLGKPSRGTTLNLLFLVCAALTGFQAANSSAARKLSIGLNIFEVLVWTVGLSSMMRAASLSQSTPGQQNVTILMTFGIIFPCAISALLMIRMRKKDLLAL